MVGGGETMVVKDLIKLLEEFEPDHTVYLGIGGIVRRSYTITRVELAQNAMDGSPLVLIVHEKHPDVI